MPTLTLYNGDVFEVLKQIESNSIDSICTSPPYFALRSYKGAEKIWDAKEGCDHEWIEHHQSARGGTNEDSIVGANSDTEANNRGHPTITNSCKKCSAWKGQLGLETDYNLFISHLLQITAELKRVLKPTGTLWWNMGDSFAGNMGKRSGWDNSPRHDNEKAMEEGTAIKFKSNYGGIKNKSKMLIPERLAMKMMDEQGWILRNNVIWKKTSAVPSSKVDALTPSYEYIFFFVKNDETQYWINNKLGKATDKQPAGVNGIEGEDWEWREHPTKGKIKKTLWRGWDYYFDLDAIRRKIEYPNQSVKELCEEIYHKAKEMRSQVKLLAYEGKVQTENAEMLNSPRARQLRSSGGSIQEFIVAIRTVAIEVLKQHPELSHADKNFINNFQHNTSGNLIGSNPGDVWSFNSEPIKEEHFAGFPSELPRRAFMAGSPKEVCSACGKPKVPIVKVGRPENYDKLLHEVDKEWAGNVMRSNGTFNEKLRPITAIYGASTNTTREVIGTTPTCSCEKGFVPATILDPFAGSGTSLLVAKEMGINAIGIEISESYCRIIERRTHIRESQMLKQYDYKLITNGKIKSE